jgi:hypothetical protein
MISEAMIFLRDEARQFLLRDKAISDEKEVVLGNVASLEDQASLLAFKVIITLVNVEEESTLKNGHQSIRNAVTNGIEKAPPPVFLNLYLLFSSTLPQSGTDDSGYADALDRINSIIKLFQSKKVFTLQNSPGFEPSNVNERLLPELRLYPELYTLTFEQINHLWGSLGGKQSPFVMYKVRLVKIQGGAITEGPLISSVRTEAHDKHPSVAFLKEKEKAKEN